MVNLTELNMSGTSMRVVVAELEKLVNLRYGNLSSHVLGVWFAWDDA